MNIGNKFYNKKIERMAKLPKSVKVLSKKSTADHSNVCVFVPEKNKKEKGLNSARIYVPCRFDIIKKSFVPFKTDNFFDILDFDTMVHN